MNDHELDDQMRRLTQSYNEPPAVPREAMWAQIERARADRSAIPVVAVWRKSWLRTAAGIAAVLVVGIGIGRLTRGVGSNAVQSVASSTTAAHVDTVQPSAIAVVASNAAPTEGRVAAGERAEPARAEGQGRASVGNPVRATRDERIRALRDDRSVAARGGLASYGVQRGASSAAADGGDRSAYRLAVVEHMARAEVLLTSFLAESRSAPTDARTVAQFASLSRDLLKTTRLLLATKTSDDPALTRLLEDLELVLMQISQYTSEGRRGDLDAINQSIDRRNVLPKLRSTIPAGASASTGI